jgi:8-oxo-dGTP pyrophosphatase MutT (NUDIX family)
VATLSCGVLVLNAGGELLLCHATGTPRWDIPKGGAEVGERALDAAIRETAEETGLAFAPTDLLDLGERAYRPGKRLHLFATLSDRFDAAACHCSTHFVDRFGRTVPEMDGFAWVAFDAVPQRVGKSLAALLSGPLALDAVLRALRERSAHATRTG